MAGTKAGGKAAAKTNKLVHGEDFYQRIGQKGGSKGRTGGFYANRERASYYGTIGGSISTRGQKLSPHEKLKRRKEIEKNLAELQKIHDQAQTKRLANEVQ